MPWTSALKKRLVRHCDVVTATTLLTPALPLQKIPIRKVSLEKAKADRKKCVAALHAPLIRDCGSSCASWRSGSVK